MNNYTQKALFFMTVATMLISSQNTTCAYYRNIGQAVFDYEKQQRQKQDAEKNRIKEAELAAERYEKEAALKADARRKKAREDAERAENNNAANQL